MKKFYCLAAAMLLCVASVKALDPYNPPEFNPEEWTLMGTGVYYPGVFDYLGNEYPYDLPAKFFESNSEENVFWIEVDGSQMKPFEPEKYEGDTWFDAPAPFIAYCQDPEKVYVSPIWAQHPAIFCFYHNVPDIMGMLGSEANYGKRNGNIVRFPAECFKWLTNPLGQPASNLEGTSGFEIPDPSGIETVEVNANVEAEYYNIQGVKIANPERGNLYIVKTGKKSKKVIF